MKAIIHFVIKSEANFSFTLFRIIFGTLFFMEGTKKVWGWFGGSGIEDVIGYFEDLGIPMPTLNAYMAGYTETFCGAAVLIGLFSRLAALPLAITMGVAIVTAHLNGGFEYPLLLLVSALLIAETGSGKLAVDRWLAKRV